MNNIDETKPVLVTGGTGYIAGWLIKRLLEEGMLVHATVRDPKAKEKTSHLDEIAASTSGSIKYFKADLLHPGSFAEAMENCEVVFHMASPFINTVNDPQKELVDPALKGTANVLEEAINTSSVKRVVLTSSCAAIYGDAIDIESTPNGILTEDIWNTTSSLDYQPYSYSKTVAEKKAWEIAKTQNQWDLVTINPSLVMGPPLNPTVSNSESLSILKQLGDGTMKAGVPNVGIGLVDVRDVAEAHFRAAFTKAASGRYITSAHNSNFVEMAEALQSKYGKTFPIPKGAAPKWLLMIIGPLLNKGITRKYLRHNVNIEWRADKSKIIRDLNMNFRPLQETMEEAFQVLIDEGILKAK